jgi:hypothetical protein
LICDITGASVQFVYDGSTWEVYAQIGGNGGTAVTLDGVQTLTNKTWNSNTIGVAYGGTGLTAVGTAGQVLTVNSGATALEYASVNSLGSELFLWTACA